MPVIRGRSERLSEVTIRSWSDRPTSDTQLSHSNKHKYLQNFGTFYLPFLTNIFISIKFLGSFPMTITKYLQAILPSEHSALWT